MKDLKSKLAPEVLETILKLHSDGQTQKSIANYLNSVLMVKNPISGKDFIQTQISDLLIECGHRSKVEYKKLPAPAKTLSSQEASVKNDALLHHPEQEEIVIDDNYVFEQNGKAFTNTLYVAQTFGKEHKNVLSAIENLKCSLNFRSANFQADVYTDTYNRPQPMYLLTEKGFSMLAFGFTGEKADLFKEKFLDKFEEMANILNAKSTITSTIIPQEIIEPEELALLQAQNIVNMKRELKAVSSKVSTLEATVHQLVNQKEYNTQKFLEAPRSTIIPLQVETRTKINELVKWFAAASEIEIQAVWRKLYKQFLLRYKIDVYARSASKNLSKLDYIESIFHMEQLFAVATEILVLPDTKKVS
jgi:Rha family phage regulatory protein